MTVYLVAIEPGEQPVYAKELDAHDLIAVHALAGVAADAEIVSVFIEERIDDAFLESHPRLRLIATRSASLDHVDLEACAARNVAVCKAPEYSVLAVAEHTFALTLSLARRLRELMALPHGGKFSYDNTRGFELWGKTLGLIGMGRIAQRVAELAEAFSMRVLAYDIRRSPNDGREFVSLETLLAESHVISLHANLTPATYHILNRETLAQTRRGVLIINTARGALIDTEALRDSLESGQVGGAGLDVLEDERLLRTRIETVISEGILEHLRSDELAQEARDADRLDELKELLLGNALLSRPNVVFTPHVAFNTVEAMHRLAAATCENILAFIAGAPVRLVQAKSPAAAGDSAAS